MICPYCGNNETKVTDKRDDDKENVTRRRRECLRCNKRFTTYERVEQIELTVIKKDGSRQGYDRTKLESGILKACEKRPLCLSNASNLVDQVEQEIKQSTKKEISSRMIGELVMERLKKIDEVAYVRFASVYRSFSDIDSFEQELSRLKNEDNNSN